MEATKSILTEFLCSSCDKLMHPPIRCCAFGHNFCVQCDKQHAACPLCRHCKGPGRNILLENLYEHFHFPCDHQEYGCMFVGKGSAVKEHVKDCEYSVAVCPLKVLQCPWHGRKVDIFNHAVDHHSSNVIELPLTNPSLLLGSKLAASTFVQVLIKAFSELFLFTWCLNSDCTSMRWSLMYLGAENAENYNFHVDFYNPFDSQTVLHIETKCNSPKHLTFEEYSDKNLYEKISESDHVQYKLSIMKKRVEEETI